MEGRPIAAQFEDFLSKYKHNDINNKPISKLRLFCSTTKAVPCRYCGTMTRHSSSIGDCSVDINDIDKIIDCPHVRKC